MTVEVKAPLLPESIADGVLLRWCVAEGDSVALDQLLAEIETDKVVLEVLATSSGVIRQLLVAEGDTVLSEQVLAELSPAEVAAAEAAPAAAPAPAAPDAASVDERAGPAARLRQRKAAQDPASVTQESLPAAAAPAAAASPSADEAPASATEASSAAPAKVAAEPASEPASGQPVRQKMSRLRQTIAARMQQARQHTAMLTTFNEVDMTAVIELRRQHRDDFERAHGVRLGMMSFFVRACALALGKYPVINASIDGDDILYHPRPHLGVAVSTDRGLAVPVLRNADQLSLAEIEAALARLADKARAARLVPEDLMGGTFTISNGGVFGSLMSTPILNPPQSAILGMHRLQQRPVAVDGEVVIRPMMYLALSYDHRLIDGREAVGFLVAVRDMVQNPATMLLDL